MRIRNPLDTYLKEPKMEAWSLTRPRLTKFLRDAVVKRFNYDPLVEVHEISSGEFRIRISHMDSRIGPRYFRVKVIQEI